MRVRYYPRLDDENLLNTFAVFEWDASSHAYAYELWEKAILSDGGEGCRRMIEMTGEPLIEGMLVGKEKNILTTSETHQVWINKTEAENALQHDKTTFADISTAERR